MKIIISQGRLAAALVFGLALTTHAANSSPQNSKGGNQPARSTTRGASEDYAKYYFICSSPDSKHDQSLTINCIVVSLAEQRLYAYQGNDLSPGAIVPPEGRETKPRSALSKSPKSISIIAPANITTRPCPISCA